MIKKSGNTYEDGFNDGAQCAWQEFSKLVDDFLNEASANNISYDYAIEEFLTNLMTDVKSVEESDTEHEKVVKFSDNAINWLEK